MGGAPLIVVLSVALFDLGNMVLWAKNLPPGQRNVSQFPLLRTANVHYGAELTNTTMSIAINHSSGIRVWTVKGGYDCAKDWMNDEILLTGGSICDFASWMVPLLFQVTNSGLKLGNIHPTRCSISMINHLNQVEPDC